MRYTIVIPARLKSTRLPNKMLLPLKGAPLIEWTWHAAKKCAAEKVIIATDDPKIFAHMEKRGAEVVMTSPKHESGTDRLSEVSALKHFAADEIIVNWQGDEPFLPAKLIELAAKALITAPDAAMSTLATPLTEWEEVYNPNVVKLVKDHQNLALYFSRSPLPYIREGMEKRGKLPKEHPYLRHIGLYAYRAGFLNRYPTLKPSALESLERLEQLRALENGFKISVALSEEMPPNGIDTQEDLLAAENWIQKLNLSL